MLFKEYHIPMIRSGSKTVTRREWADNYVGPNVGTVVAAKTDLLKPDEECECFIRITRKEEEPLGEITEAEARREGDYDTVEEFRDAYEEVYGDRSWDGDKEVTVVEFEYVGESRPGDTTEQAELVADGGQSDGGVARTDGGTTPQEILNTESEKANTPAPEADRYDSSTEAARELLTEWVATHVDERKIATAKQIVNESDRDDIHINDVGRTLGCRQVGVTPNGFLDEVELSTWGDANVTSWVFERVDGHRERTETRGDRLFKPELVEEISDAVGGIHEEYYRRTHDNCRRVEVSAEWKRAVTLALVEASATELKSILTGYDEERPLSFDEYVARLSTPELTNIVEQVLKPDEELGTPHGWPRELLIPVHDVLVSGIDPAEVDA